MILVITSPGDRTADRVVDAVRRRARYASRIDLAEFPTSMEVAAHLDGDQRSWRSVLSRGDERIHLDDVDTIYYRRPGPFVFPGHLSPSDRAFALAEARRGIGGVLLALSCRWVNHPGRTATAEFKPAQLATARSCGLRVPRSLLTSDPGAAREFCSELGTAALYKPLSAANLRDGDEHRLVFTTRVTESDLVDDDVAVTANLFQEWIPKDHDARVTVFGKRVFGVAIETDSPEAHLDWRIDYTALRYRPVEVPPDVESAMIQYLDAFGLLFGAFDFAVADDGWYFLECNANGQFGWMEAETGLPMTEAMADLLLESAP